MKLSKPKGIAAALEAIIAMESGNTNHADDGPAGPGPRKARLTEYRIR